MHTAGVCHTDISAVRDARCTPLLLGHEGVGTVDSVGAGVDESRLGQRVLLSWRTPCGSCRRCLQARPHICLTPRGAGAGSARRDGRPLARLLDTGCFATYAVVPAQAAIAIPPELSEDRAAVVGCAVATGVGAVLFTARVAAGDSVAVWGAGGVGLNVIAAAAFVARAGVVVAFDPDPSRRAAAEARGAIAGAPEDASAIIAHHTDGFGVDHAFEVVGSPATMGAAIDALAVGGQLTLVGAAARDAPLAFAPRRFMSRQQRIAGCIYGSLRPAVDLPLLLDWCRAGVIPVDDMLGERVTLADLPGVFERPPAGIRTMVVLS
jgi:S-(hydroxymethyl)glutathione dehydrogenase/alcohol dehydrogenase